MSNIMFDAREVMIPGSVYDRSKFVTIKCLWPYLNLIFFLNSGSKFQGLRKNIDQSYPLYIGLFLK
jgi:hypothetical protein